MRTTGLTMAVTLVSWLGGVAQAQQVELKYVPPKEGEVYVLHIAQDMVGTMEGITPTSQAMTQRMEQWLRLECLDVDERGNTTLRGTIERISNTMSMGPINFTYDSAAPRSDAGTGPFGAGNPFTEAIGALVGVQIETRLNAKGEVLELKGVEQISDRMAKAVGHTALLEQLKGMYDSDDFRQNSFQHLSWLPNRAVSVGETWTQEQTMDFGQWGRQLVKTKYKLLGFEEVEGVRCARVGATMNLEMVSGDLTDPAGSDDSMRMNMTSTGGTMLLLWDPVRGVLVRSKSTMPAETSITTVLGGDASKAMTMKGKMTMSQFIEMLPGDAVPVPPMPAQPASVASAATVPVPPMPAQPASVASAATAPAPASQPAAARPSANPAPARSAVPAGTR